MSKRKINEKFFDKWKPEMAYTLGYFFADGTMIDCKEIRAKYISITSTDKDRITLFRSLIESEHTIICEPALSSKRKDRYILRIGSHVLFNKLTTFGLYPNKSLTVRFPIIPQGFLQHFIRGYFDGDGCVYLEKTKNINGKLIIKRLLVAFTSGSQEFLLGLGEALKKVTNTEFRIYNSHRSHQLRYNTKDTMKLFEFMYNNVHGDLFTRRKYIKYKEYFSLRPERITSKSKVILEKHN